MSRASVFSLRAAAGATLDDAPTSAHPVGFVGLAARALQSRAFRAALAEQRAPAKPSGSPA